MKQLNAILLMAFFAWMLLAFIFTAIISVSRRGEPPPMLIEAGAREDAYCDINRMTQPPLLRSPNGSLDYRVGGGFNDKGTA